MKDKYYYFIERAEDELDILERLQGKIKWLEGEEALGFVPSHRGNDFPYMLCLHRYDDEPYLSVDARFETKESFIGLYGHSVCSKFVFIDRVTLKEKLKEFLDD